MDEVKRSGFDKFQKSMDRMLQQQNIQSIKKTMQQHEEVFKHQVRELHRLYSIQRMLMDELKTEMKQYKDSGARPGSNIKQSQFINHQIQTINSSAYDLHLKSMRDDPKSWERSSSCYSGDTLRMTKRFNIERPREEEISIRGSDIEHGRENTTTCTDGDKEDYEVELTLSIGSSSGKKRSEVHQQHSSLQLGHTKSNRTVSIKTDRGEEGDDTNNKMSSSNESFNEESKRLHWLFHCQSLNRT